ncbi:hypothetical protein M5D96_002897 [Drosophila gunungcola]|uniref:Uncharacterized protein n=1 Tax=Drosophila gunungcola TaxID=103775 RepID=A0A9Q0BWX1_9MUSC|nr:hypothetical protein M5D96_002897 [Drosophila gunungcola]
MAHAIGSAREFVGNSRIHIDIVIVMCCISATTMRRASWKSHSSLAEGLSWLNASATRLCSRASRI